VSHVQPASHIGLVAQVVQQHQQRSEHDDVVQRDGATTGDQVAHVLRVSDKHGALPLARVALRGADEVRVGHAAEAVGAKRSLDGSVQPRDDVGRGCGPWVGGKRIVDVNKHKYGYRGWRSGKAVPGPRTPRGRPHPVGARITPR
jgi:hypothetical protein